MLKLFLVLGLTAVSPAAEVHVVRAPAGGVQPQAAVNGAVHVVYLSGEPAAADVYYATLKGEAFSAPQRVNSVAGSAIAMGTIRGAQIAAGRNGYVHVAWNGGGVKGLWYARGKDGRFEAQRNLLGATEHLDGGTSIAADAAGNVYVVWHAAKGTTGEGNRRVFAAHSSDDGRTFAPERPVTADPTGACACCSLKALAAGGGLYTMYRSATGGVHRDTYLVAGAHATLVDRWEINACPMSSYSLFWTGGGLLGAWETQQQIYWAEFDARGTPVGARIAAPGSARRKHPVIARNPQGDTILVWTEGTGWKKGGSLAWQVYDRSGRPAGAPGHAEGVPVWSLATVVAGADGSFTIIY